jgi:hypothetical protein
MENRMSGLEDKVDVFKKSDEEGWPSCLSGRASA